MAVNLKKYIENPEETVRKIRRRFIRNKNLTIQFLAGQYTTGELNLSWEGKPERMDVINKAIAQHGYKKYLEIGCRDDSCFNKIAIGYKVGVDPEQGGTLRMTSDAFFAQNKEKFDIIFIDGLHEYRQVARDIDNSVKALNPGGTIVMHDCLPTKCLAQYDFPVIDAWNGDVWKAFVEARTRPDLDGAVVMIDHGVGLIKVRKNPNPLAIRMRDFKKLRYKNLVDNYRAWLNTIEFADVAKFIAN